MKYILLTAALTLAASPLSAATTTYTFTAEFDARPYNDGIADNSAADLAQDLGTISGSFDVDDTVISDNGSVARFAVSNFMLDQTALNFTAYPDQLNQRNNFGTTDQVSLTHSSANTQTYYNAVEIVFNSYGSPGSPSTLFDDTTYKTLLDPIDPADFDIVQLYFYSSTERPGQSDGFDRTNFVVTSWEVQTPAVPLPAGLPLLLGGIAAFAAVRRRG